MFVLRGAWLLPELDSPFRLRLRCSSWAGPYLLLWRRRMSRRRVDLLLLVLGSLTFVRVFLPGAS